MPIKRNFRKMLAERLAGKLSLDDINEICFITQGDINDRYKEELYSFVKDSDDRMSYNALWVFAHFDLYNNQWLYGKHDELIDLVMKEKHEGKKRLLLTLILRQPFVEEKLRTDFIDYCLSGIATCENSNAVRVLCMKLSYEQCKYHPELLSELEGVMDMMYDEALSSGLLTARRNIIRRIRKG